jgi:hydrogenase expression/formation protein HypE
MKRSPYPDDSFITLAHGSGGRKMHRLIRRLFLRHFGNPQLNRLEDAAEFAVPRAMGRTRELRFALTTDSFVVQPLFFPGGDIGKLAVCGTVNDLTMKGAVPRYLSAGFIISAGFPVAQLERICRSMTRTARQAGVSIVTGDTKVLDVGSHLKQPELFINTSGLGTIPPGVHLGAEHVRPGDRVLINGSIGDHEAAIVLARGEFEFQGNLRSDCAPLNDLVQGLIRAGVRIRMMRDPTRGGVATTLNEIAEASGLGIVIQEAALAVKPQVRGVCELLGLEPPYLANEGKVLVVIDRRDAAQALTRLRRHPRGRQASAIADVTDERTGVWLQTRLGAMRPLLMLEGQQLPRIC